MPPAEQRTGTPSTLCIEPRIIRPRASLPAACVCPSAQRQTSQTPCMCIDLRLSTADTPCMGSMAALSLRASRCWRATRR
jgi:hypothetical protein